MERPARIPEKGDVTAAAITLRSLERRACGWRFGAARPAAGRAFSSILRRGG
jgi:hypothetical protein